MRIAVDGMGGDNAPHAVVEGAIYAAKEYPVDILLLGPKEILEKELKKHKQPFSKKIEIFHAPSVVDMHDSPTISIRKKKDSSINIGLELLKNKEVDAFISAGNTGAVVCSAIFNLGALPGIERPGIAIVIPTLVGFTLLIDVGANIDPKPIHLLHYALMGNTYSKYILGKQNPAIGLLSVGEEETKGTDFIKETHKLLNTTNFNFIGNVEGRDIFTGKADVIVCDGFVGNVVLKVSEGLADTIATLLKRELRKSIITKTGALLSQGAFRALAKETDYSEYGGAPLLGVDGACFISHGSSCSKAMKNAIRIAADFTKHRINEKIISEAKECQGVIDSEKATLNNIGE